MAPAHIRLRCQKVAPEPQISHPHPSTPPNPPSHPWIGHPQRVRPGRVRSDERRYISNDQTRGDERGEMNGSDGGGGGDIEGGKDFKNNNN